MSMSNAKTSRTLDAAVSIQRPVNPPASSPSVTCSNTATVSIAFSAAKRSTSLSPSRWTVCRDPGPTRPRGRSTSSRRPAFDFHTNWARVQAWADLNTAAALPTSLSRGDTRPGGGLPPRTRGLGPRPARRISSSIAGPLVTSNERTRRGASIASDGSHQRRGDDVDRQCSCLRRRPL